MTARAGDHERVQLTGRAAWRAWLAAHHADTAGVWAVTYKQAAAGPTLPYGELVEEGLCFGWIDSKAQGLDADRTMLLFTPRRPGSRWSGTNKARVARLRAGGLMTPAGEAAVAAAQADGSWTALDRVEALEEDDDLRDALDATPDARAHWAGFPASAKRLMLTWLLDAKRPETRAKRIAEIATKAARGERAR